MSAAKARESLTACLSAWGVLNPADRARGFIDGLIADGWTPPAPRPEPKRTAGDRKAALIAEIRQTIRDNQHPEDQ